MPAKSAKQYRLMAAIAHGNLRGLSGSPTQAVAKEFVEKTPPKKRQLFARK